MGNRSRQLRCSSPGAIHPAPSAPCGRCGGLLVTDTLFDHLGPRWEERDACRRCVNCGSIDDPVIRANRRRGADSPAFRRSAGARTPTTPIWMACATGRRSSPRLGPTGAD